MGSQIETIYLNDVIENHTQDMGNKVVAITGTTTGTGFVCAREVGKKEPMSFSLIVKVRDPRTHAGNSLKLFRMANSILFLAICKVLRVFEMPWK